MVYSDIVNGIASNTSNNSTLSSTQNVASENKTSLDVNDFLKLLVAQMQYQDPLEPTDNTEYIAQMATFSQVEATTAMGSRVEEQMASTLVGKNVIMKTNLNQEGMIAGQVDYWEKINGTVYLGIEGKLYDLSDLDTVMDDDYFKEFME